jgi:hypothetical protein
VAFLISKAAAKKTNVGGPVKPTVNSILLEIGQVNQKSLFGIRIAALKKSMASYPFGYL